MGRFRDIFEEEHVYSTADKSGEISTHCVNLLMHMYSSRNMKMIPRSDKDKEYFAQDWASERFTELDLIFRESGRNEYPDFWIGNYPSEGYEVKGLSIQNGRAARKDLDFNSSIPCGRKNGDNIFLMFFLYKDMAEGKCIHTLSIAHGDLINSDNDLSDSHSNKSVCNFGSYGDGFIRYRKMYRFPHPVSIDNSSFGRFRLIVPYEWGLLDNRLKIVNRVSRKNRLFDVLEPVDNLPL